MDTTTTATSAPCTARIGRKRATRTSTASAAGRTSTIGEIHQRADQITALLRLPWIDAEQAAIVVGCSPSSIRRACRSKRLQHVRLNGSKLIRLTPDALREWANGTGAA